MSPFSAAQRWKRSVRLLETRAQTAAQSLSCNRALASSAPSPCVFQLRKLRGCSLTCLTEPIYTSLSVTSGRRPRAIRTEDLWDFKQRRSSGSVRHTSEPIYSTYCFYFSTDCFFIFKTAHFFPPSLRIFVWSCLTYG